MSLAVARLRRLAAALHAGRAPERDDAEAVADAIEAALDTGLPLDDALDLRPAKGQRSIRTLAALAERDGALRELAELHFAGCSDRQQAERIEQALRRYRIAGWPLDRLAEKCPPGRKGTPAELLWRALKAVDAPLSAQRIRVVLRVGREFGGDDPPAMRIISARKTITGAS